MNMHVKGPDRARDFLENFNQCSDGIVRRIQMVLPKKNANAKVRLTLSVQRPLSRRIRNGWVNVRLTINDVEEFALRESHKESCQVISSGLHITDVDGLLYFDFAPYTVSPRGIDDLRRSAFFVAGRSFTWKVEEYAE